MSVLVIDVGGDNFDLGNWTRAGQAPPIRVGDFSRSFSGAKRSHIREELQVVPMVTGPISTADHDTIYGYFPLGARVDCQGTCFRPTTGVVTCTGDLTSEMVPGGVDDDGLPMWIVNLTLEVVSTAGGGLGGMPLSVSPDDAITPSGIIWDYDAQALTGITNGSTITLWPDSGPLGNDAPANAPSYAGVYDSTAMNGFPGVAFSPQGNNQRGYATPTLSTVTYPEGEAFIVLRTPTSGGGPFWGLGSITYDANVPYAVGQQFRDHFGSTGQMSFTMPVSPNEPFLYHVKARAGLRQAWINGVEVYNSTTNTLAWDGPYFGMWLSGGAFYQPATFWIGEFIFQSPFMDPADATALETSLMTKWGIT